MERMLDITFCCNEECNKRKDCLRGQENKLSHEYISNADFNCDESYEFFIPIKKQITKRYRVESKSKTNHFRSDCTEEELEYWKAICKSDSIENNGECFYREFPVTKNSRVYYAKDNPRMTQEELELINEKLNRRYTMTLDEAIVHAEEVANSECSECSNEHKQLAEWLRELKQYREAKNKE